MNTADEFLKQKHLFQLGDLPTETPHPQTVNLSELAKNDVEAGLNLLREIDLSALNKILSMKEELRPVFAAVSDTLDKGHKVYLVGCGATGRLSMSLEYLWRRKYPQSNQVCSLMAGGDVALVQALEGFEDFPQHGARHLNQLGFGPDDLLIGTTEGGETPYVIGAVEEAASKSSRKPLFLFCNPPKILTEKVERSKRVLTNPSILSFYLETGPMALTGSTRMQASTVLMLVAGLALEYRQDTDAAFRDLAEWIRFFGKTPAKVMKPFVEKEAETYQEGNYTCYTVDEFAMTVFTDTTERAPTFNLAPFDNPKHLTARHSLTYIALPETKDARSAWHSLLAHTPRPLNWSDVNPKTADDYLYTFDFSVRALDFRKHLVPSAKHFEFSIHSRGDEMVFKFRDLEARIPLFNKAELFDHLTVKTLLNMHSTLTMGRLNRFEGNLMTWLYPSNGKLIDRAARYTQILLKKMNKGEFAYDDIVRAQFKAKAELSPKESIVHKTIEILVSGRTRQPESRAPR